MLCTFDSIAAFKHQYDFPPRVDIRLIGPKDDGWVVTDEGTPFPLIAILEEGLRFPIHPFSYKIASIQLAPNGYRTMMG